MRATLRAASARLIVGHIDPEHAAELLTIVDARDKPITFALAEPEGLAEAAAVPAGAALETGHSEPVRWGKLVLETVGNEVLASPRKDTCDAVVDGLRVAHRRLGSEGLELIPRGSSGVGFCSASIVNSAAQIVVVPPSQVFVVHQGVALVVPESDQVGRGIWMRDDLRAELFAGIGGLHEPDIRVYEAIVSPGDTLVLASSDLARMLTEDDVRLAVTYEEAATAAERLKQLAIQRGVEAGLALVVEFSGSLEDGETGANAVEGPRPGLPLRIEMPPIGSIFNTAREWLLEAVDRVQESVAASEQPLANRHRPAMDEDIPWPVRPRPGAWRSQLPSGRVQVSKGGQQDTRPIGDPALGPVPSSGEAEVQAASALNSDPGYGASSARPYMPAHRLAYARHDRRPGRGSRALPRPQLNLQLGPGLTALRERASHLVSPFVARIAPVRLAGKRNLLVPVASGLFVVLVAFAVTRTVKAQQARQVQQRFDSLVTAAGQLEMQARGTTDRVEALSLMRRSQALVDQAATLRSNAPQVATLRAQLQIDADHLDNIYAWPDAATLVNFGSLAKDVRATALAGDNGALYALDGGGQRVLQFLRDQKQAGVAASQGDAASGNKLGAPKVMAVRGAGDLLILDSNRALWSYSTAKHALQQVGLKSADTWKEATAMAAFGQNLYILDATQGNIFRYTSREGTFTEAPSRFLDKDNHDLLGQASSMAIDGSIWLLNNDGSMLKLANGAAQPFPITGLAQPLGKGGQLYTDGGEQSLYVLDTASNRLVQIGKDGHYVRQFKYSLPAPPSGFWPDEAGHQAYMLSNNTVYQFGFDTGR
jgi:hypothetical protein